MSCAHRMLMKDAILVMAYWSRRRISLLLLVLAVFVFFLSARSFMQQKAIVVKTKYTRTPDTNYVLLAEKQDSMRAGVQQAENFVTPKDSLGEASEGRQPAKAPGRSRRNSRNSIDRKSVQRPIAAERRRVDILFILKKAGGSYSEKFVKFIKPLLGKTSSLLTLHAIVDKASKSVVAQNTNHAEHVHIEYYDSTAVEEEIKYFVAGMREVFSSGPGNYFDDPLFFVSPVLYRILPESVDRVIVLDIDVELRADIAELASYFDHFKPDQVIGLAHEAQPVYRHILYKYRQNNPDTNIGDPPPEGLPGFNSGVMLQDLKRIRSSRQYLGLTDSGGFGYLTEKYSFKGHLGDQDYYSLISFDYGDLFFVLPCTWNRQLCRYWESGYKDVFMQYYQCEGEIKLYHGNCQTPIPVN